MGNLIAEPKEQPMRPRSRIRAWGALIMFVLFVWVFGAIIGPWGEKNIPVFNQIVEVIKERDINSSAYFYTEIEASYNGEQYLSDSLKFAKHRDSEFNLVFFSGVFTCIVILCIGYRYLPDD